MSTATGDSSSVSMMVKAEELSLQESSLLLRQTMGNGEAGRLLSYLKLEGRERGVEDGSELVR